MISWALQKVQSNALEAAGFRREPIRTSVGDTSVWRYRGEGKLPTLVVQHGISSSGGDMARLLLRLRAHFGHIVAPDLLGHGYSDHPSDGASSRDIEVSYLETLTQVLDGPALFFGNSLGGLAGLKLALRSPDLLSGLMMCSPGGAGGQTQEELDAFFAQFRVQTYREAATFVNRVHAKPVWYASLMAGSIYKRLTSPTVQRLLSEVTEDNLVRPEHLAEIRLPLALVWGQAEALMPKSHRDFYVDNLPKGAALIEPVSFGHCPHLDEPGALSKVIIRWAESLREG